MTSVSLISAQYIEYIPSESREEETRQLEKLVDALFKDVYPNFETHKPLCVEVLIAYNQREVFEHQGVLRKFSQSFRMHGFPFAIKILRGVMSAQDRWDSLEIVTSVMREGAIIAYNPSSALNLIQKNGAASILQYFPFSKDLMNLTLSAKSRVRILEELMKMPIAKARAICECIPKYTKKTTHGNTLHEMVKSFSEITVQEIEEATKFICKTTQGLKTIHSAHFNQLLNLFLKKEEVVYELASSFLAYTKSSYDFFEIIDIVHSLKEDNIGNLENAMRICNVLRRHINILDVLEVCGHLTDEVTDEILELLSSETKLRERQINFITYLLQQNATMTQVRLWLPSMDLVDSVPFSVLNSIPNSTINIFVTYANKFPRVSTDESHSLFPLFVALWSKGKLGVLDEWEDKIAQLKSPELMRAFFDVLTKHPECDVRKLYDLIVRLSDKKEALALIREVKAGSFEDFLDFVVYLESGCCDEETLEVLKFLSPKLREECIKSESLIDVDMSPIENLLSVLTSLEGEMLEEARNHISHMLDLYFDNSEIFDELCKNLDENMDGLGLTESHPLYQKMAEMQVMEEYSAPLNKPSRVFRFHKVNSFKEVDIGEKRYTYNGRELVLNDQLLRDVPIPLVTKSMLPEGISCSTLQDLQQRSKENCSALTDERIKGILMSIPEEGEVSTLAYSLVASLYYLTTLEGDVFDTQLMLFNHMISECSTGKEEGIISYYNGALPHSFRITPQKAHTRAEKRAEESIKQALIHANRSMTSVLNPFTKYLSGDLFTEESNQVAHVTKYIRNLIGAELGLQKRGVVIYDVWTTELNERLLKLTKENLLSLFYDYCTPEYYVQNVLSYINRQLTDDQNELDVLYERLRKKEIKKSELDKAKPTLRGDLVNYMNQEDIFDEEGLQISEEGALKLILKTSLYKVV